MWLRILVVMGVLFVVVTWTTQAQRGEQTPSAPIVEPAVEQAAEKKSVALPAHFHNAAVRAFGTTPGFGRGRMIVMKHEIEDIYVDWSPGEIDEDAPPIDVPDLAKLHRKSSGVLAWDLRTDLPTWLDGMSSRMSSRHQDGSKHTWVLNSVNLLALVDHAEPVVYITSKLPIQHEDEPHAVGKKADRSGYTRPLDFLESAALARLHSGEEMFQRVKNDSLRMVGALRASKQCLECHAGKEGDLFGAFSYTLTKVAH